MAVTGCSTWLRDEENGWKVEKCDKYPLVAYRRMRALTYQILCPKTTQLIVAPSGAININLAHTVAIPHPSRAVQFVDAPASKFTPCEHDPHIGESVVVYGNHVAAAGR
jgi:hypothetical protein